MRDKTKTQEAPHPEVAKAIIGQTVVGVTWNGENLDGLHFSNGKILLFNRNHDGVVRVTIANRL